MVNVYKERGDALACGSYRGIKLLRVGILPAKTYFCQDSGKNRFLPFFSKIILNSYKMTILFDSC